MTELSDRARAKLAAHEPLTYEEAEHFIIDVPARSDQAIFRGNDGFKRSQAFLALLDNPQDARPTIHIAGTSGKGSVVVFLSSLLQKHGKSVASYSSPHVYTLRERWKLNGEMVSENDFIAAVAEVYPAIEKMKKSKWGAPTYFEITTALAFLLCRRWGVDYAVIETGMGGLLDTTNTIARRDKLAVIAELGYDHTHILGNTLAEIAYQKAGILTRDGHAVVLKPYDESAANVITKTARERHTDVRYISDQNYKSVRTTVRGTFFDYTSDRHHFENIELGLLGDHQAKNASLALAALEYVAGRDKFTIDGDATREALRAVHLPGRFERRTIMGVETICDGAHNPQKLGAFCATLQAMYPGRTFTWLMALGKTKDAAAIMPIIAPYVDEIVFTRFFANQDMVLSSKASDT
ncbi:MAG TPA: Mur ligase family protein, partial [Candidatus Saccharimonadaceae bacterium]|nr:Mur ligase family protein [Candidatus Saccharimonadaceae bacterium]